MDIHDPKTVRPFARRRAYRIEDILAFANREFGDDLPPLPLPPMLMLHRIIDISDVGGTAGIGCAVAEYDVHPDDWYFPCHFKGNPIMPGCLGIDAAQQLAGFTLAWMGARGDGMAMSVDGVKFRGKVTPDSGTLRIVVEVVHLKLESKVCSIRASGLIHAGAKLIYSIDQIVVGVVRRPKT